jgi:hypothetical protein
MPVQQRATWRWPIAAIFLTLVGMLVSACSAPGLGDASQAASLNGQRISMAQYVAETRLIDAVDRVNDPTIPTWQNPQGRQSLTQAQQRVLSLLISNIVLRHNVKISDSDLKKQEDAKLKQLFSQVPPQYKPLVDQGILTPETYRPFVEEQILQSLYTQNLTVNTAHIRILTTKTKAQADALLKQLQGGATWSTLAVKNSIDGAAGSGGEIPTLVPYFLPPQIDAVVFGAKQVPNDSNHIYEVQSHMGWSLVQVVSRTPNVKFSALDNTAPIISNAQVSAQGAAIIGLLNHLARAEHVSVNANWCNNSSGGPCPDLFPADQV